MAQYVICDKCKELVEYSPETKYEGGTSYTILTCPHCGYIKKSNRSHIHYGNDGKK